MQTYEDETSKQTCSNYNRNNRKKIQGMRLLSLSP